MSAATATEQAQVAAAVQMLEALIVAREFISFDRNALADALGDDLSDDERAELADYDRALRQIDAAITKATTTSE